MSKYQENIDRILDRALELDNPVPVLLSGGSGVGKTAMLESLAERYNTKVIKLSCSTMSPEDISGLPFRYEVVNPDKSIGEREYNTDFGTPRWVIEANEAAAQNGRAVIFGDELSLAMLQVQGAFLTTVQSRHTPNGTKINDNVLFVFAMNPADSGIAGTIDLSLAFTNRVLIIDYNPPASDWVENMPSNWGHDENMSEEERSSRTLIASYIDHYLDRLTDDILDPEVAQRAQKGWASRRSWENVAVMIAGIEDKTLRSMIIEGLVGVRHAQLFMAWESDFALPHPKDILDNPSKVEWTKDPIKHLAMLRIAVNYATRNRDYYDKITGLIDYAFESKSISNDVVISFLPRLFGKGRPPAGLRELDRVKKSWELLGLTADSDDNLDD